MILQFQLSLYIKCYVWNVTSKGINIFLKVIYLFVFIVLSTVFTQILKYAIEIVVVLMSDKGIYFTYV